jgi:hypothetical protein
LGWTDATLMGALLDLAHAGWVTFERDQDDGVWGFTFHLDRARADAKALGYDV